MAQSPGGRTPRHIRCLPCLFWEDDPAQVEDPTLEGGANSPSLQQAQKNYETFGASDEEMVDYIRAPLPEEACDSA